MTERELTSWLQTLALDVKRTKPEFPKNVVRGCPIPFFGNVFKARVVTVGVNPSDTEFTASRWKDGLKVPAWRDSLLKYFEKSSPAPHNWFETWSICLALLNLSYRDTAAHLDISPRPSIGMLDKETDCAEFRSMVAHDVKWFFDLLSKLPHVQLLMVAGPIPQANCRKQQLADFIQDRSFHHGCDWMPGDPFPKVITSTHKDGIPVFICPYESGVDCCYAMIRHVYRTRELLKRFTRA